MPKYTLAERVHAAEYALSETREALLTKVLAIAGADIRKPRATWPFQRVGHDPCDITGWALKIRRASDHLTFTSTQLEQIWLLGFTALDVSYVSGNNLRWVKEGGGLNA